MKRRTIKQIFGFLLVGTLTSLVWAQQSSKQPVDYVGPIPIAGTSNSRWMLFPGASMPFGMVKLSPNNQRRGQEAEYEHNIKNITGFSHIQFATLNGKPLNKPWFYHKQLIEGDKLTLQMGPDPDKKWSSKPENAPPSMSG